MANYQKIYLWCVYMGDMSTFQSRLYLYAQIGQVYMRAILKSEMISKSEPVLLSKAIGNVLWEN